MGLPQVRVLSLLATQFTAIAELVVVWGGYKMGGGD